MPAMNDPVDVLIIGAGASGAAVAWSLADTKMHILCLDQGGWMNPAAYPSTGRDWEARFYGDYSPSPNIRARPEDYPDQRRQLADQGGELQRRRRLDRDVHRAFSAPASLRLPGADARRRRRRLADRLRHAGAVLRRERPHDGRLGPGRRSRLSADQPADAAAAARPIRRAVCEGDEQARLALVAVGHHGRDDGLRGAGALHQSRPLHAGLRAGRQGLDRHHLLAAGAARRRRTAHALPGPRDHHQRARHGRGRRLLRPGRRRAVPGAPKSS